MIRRNITELKFLSIWNAAYALQLGIEVLASSIVIFFNGMLMQE
ncbi:hypothetical protein LT85_2109 [Collimonas arenae]|uniref:Uncharacterized protein n=1 Tax=Collimonas arenae TaxID=279058 RepID=A0A0A1FEM9_9BURK|nr:hypothetical protein LT85_2109 [Collimonas arenae]